MRWARIVLLGCLTLVGIGVLALVALYVAQPTSYRIVRSRTIAAPPSAVRAQLDDVRAMAGWEPWRASSSTIVVTTTFSPNSSGVGAWIDRRDPDRSGARTTLTLVSDSRVEMSTDTIGAFGGGRSTQTFELRPVPGGTDVTWALAADMHGLARLLWPFVDLERRVGPDMEQALTRLDRASAP